MAAHNNAHALIYLGLIGGAVVVLWRSRSSAPAAPAAPVSSPASMAFQTAPTVFNFQTVGSPPQGAYYPLALGYMPLFGFVGVRAF